MCVYILDNYVMFPSHSLYLTKYSGVPLARDRMSESKDGEHALALQQTVASGAKFSPEWFLKQHPNLSADFCELLSLAALERWVH